MKTRIRKGGLQTPGGFLFELSAGDVALDLVNTLDERPTDHARELIPQAAHFFSWARQAGLLSRKQEEKWRAEVERKPRESERVHRRVVELRECLFLLFSSIAAGTETAPEVLAEWNKYLQEALGHYETARKGTGMVWTARSEVQRFESLLWSIIHSAFLLLTGAQSARIRRCASESCDWLFLDTSKRGNRRWCDMTVCGNRAKARRFYQRKKSSQCNNLEHK